jgi:hypothetical protein
MVIQLRKPLKVNKVLLKDIISFHSIHELKSKYLNSFGEEDNEYLYWLENNLLFYMNGMEPLADGLNEEFIRIFPNKSLDQILEYVVMNKFTKKSLERDIIRYWCHLTPERRRLFMDTFI